MSKSQQVKQLIDSVKGIEQRLQAFETNKRQLNDRIGNLEKSNARIDENVDEVMKQQRVIIERLEQQQQLLQQLLFDRPQQEAQQNAADTEHYPERDIAHPTHEHPSNPGKRLMNKVVDKDFKAALEEILNKPDVAVEIKKVKDLANDVVKAMKDKFPDVSQVKWSQLADKITSWAIDELELRTWNRSLAIRRCENSWFAKNILRIGWAQKLPRKASKKMANRLVSATAMSSLARASSPSSPIIALSLDRSSSPSSPTAEQDTWSSSSSVSSSSSSSFFDDRSTTNGKRRRL
ncbi:hypothetical protein [Absidia glauca]|uniref:Uncharacterized protein n=1 Tax=Absidia glauca TaxID=4829 RepID=A0A168L9U0_ABSGL|nr:hypothetical protein [Absidia glauca]